MDGRAAHFTDQDDLAEAPWPPLTEIATNADEVFLPTLLTADKFEHLWTTPSLQLCGELAGK
ncbi:hypothetical protein ACFP81_03660 [Deinococcus lacus]|uniref:Uncharacterized protein n=1 Tax=Deinococcus lacus TaxID=392561 RepID=A0ABW1YEA8_9DEIO